MGIALTEKLRLDNLISFRAFDSREVDLCDPERIRELLVKEDVVLNLQEFSDVDGAECDPKTAYRTNINGVRNLSYQASRLNVRVIQFSSAYVFDGTKPSPYSERDMPDPLNIYGSSKFIAEKELRAEGADYLILRTHALFGKPRQGGHFLHGLLERLRAGTDAVNVIDNQLIGPTYTEHVAEVIPELLWTERTGILHLAPDDGCTWYEFAQMALSLLDEDVLQIQPAAWEQMGLEARRPPNMLLDNHWFKTFTGKSLPSWRQGLQDALS